MSQPVVTVTPDASLADVAKAMVDHRVGCVLVVDSKPKLCGIITQSDFGDKEHGLHYSMELLLHSFTRPTLPETKERAQLEAQATRAGEVMRTEVLTACEDSPVEEIARHMLRYDIDHIPVVRNGVPIGMVARHDFLRLVAAEAYDDEQSKRQVPAMLSTTNG
jgi:CBS domain-containing protein